MPVRVHFHISQLTSKLAFHHELPSPSPFLLCVAGTASTHFSKMSILLKEPDLWNASKNWIQLQKQILQEDAAEGVEMKTHFLLENENRSAN